MIKNINFLLQKSFFIQIFIVKKRDHLYKTLIIITSKEKIISFIRKKKKNRSKEF